MVIQYYVSIAKKCVDESNKRNKHNIGYKKHLELKEMIYKFDSVFFFQPDLKELGEIYFNENNCSQNNMIRYLLTDSC